MIRVFLILILLSISSNLLSANSSIGKVIRIDTDWGLVVIKSYSNLKEGDKVFINKNELLVGAINNKKEVSLLDFQTNDNHLARKYKIGDLVYSNLGVTSYYCKDKYKKNKIYIKKTSCFSSEIEISFAEYEKLKNTTVYCKKQDDIFKRKGSCNDLEKTISLIEYNARKNATKSVTVIELHNNDQLNDQLTFVTAEEQFQNSYDLIRDQKYNEAEKALQQFIKDHKANVLSGSAHYWLGEIYVLKKEYGDAILTFTEGYQTYSSSIKAPDMLYKLSKTLFNINKNKDGCKYLKLFHTTFNKHKLYQNSKDLFDKRCLGEITITASIKKIKEEDKIVSGNNVRVRSAPNTTTSKILTTLQKGKVVVVTGETTNWFEINIPSFLKKGYIAKTYVRDFKFNEKQDTLVAANKDIQKLEKIIADKNNSLGKIIIQKKIDNTQEKEVNIQVPEKKTKPKLKIEVMEDKEGPIIEVASTINANDSMAIISGKIFDDSDIKFLSIDGDKVSTDEQGNFEKKLYIAESKTIVIKSYDKHRNFSEKNISIVNKIIEEPPITLAKLNPLAIDGKSNKDAVAIIIGVETYEDTFPAKFAKNDAQMFKGFANKVLGIPNNNIKILINEEARKNDTKKTLIKWLPNKVKENISDVYLFYSGHGLGSSDRKDLYLLPYDGELDILEYSSLKRKDIFNDIQKSNPRTVTVFLDTCYSGVSRDEEILLASAKPIFLEVEEQTIPDNFTVFSASSPNQIASSFEIAEHGLFSYFMMQGLEGNADFNKDNQISVEELFSYLSGNVKKHANSEQTPQLFGDTERILAKW